MAIVEKVEMERRGQYINNESKSDSLGVLAAIPHEEHPGADRLSLSSPVQIALGYGSFRDSPSMWQIWSTAMVGT